LGEEKRCLDTDQIGGSTSGNSIDGFHEEHEINHGLKWERIPVFFAGCMVMNDGEPFYGVQ
jgi:hypothetical protein